MKEYSKNDRAKNLLGKRPTDCIAFDQPCELGYHCPVCKYPQTYDDQVGCPYDERLEWSEYNGMIWCRVCNHDYISAQCSIDPKAGTEIFLDILEEAKKS